MTLTTKCGISDGFVLRLLLSMHSYMCVRFYAFYMTLKTKCGISDDFALYCS